MWIYEQNQFLICFARNRLEGTIDSRCPHRISRLCREKVPVLYRRQDSLKRMWKVNIVPILLQYDVIYFDLACVQLRHTNVLRFQKLDLVNKHKCTGETVEVLTETACFLFGRPPFLLKCDCLSATFTSRIAMKSSYVRGRLLVISNVWPSTEQKKHELYGRYDSVDYYASANTQR